MYDLSLLPPRVLDRIAFDGYSGCWRWTGPRNEDGYAKLRIKGVQAGNGHRVVYLVLVGPVPAGLVLDHKCRVRDCLNPDHLEPVTNAENLRRGRNIQREKTRCPAGHPYDEVNTVRVFKRGIWTRQCRECKRRRTREAYQARTAERRARGEIRDYRKSQI